MAQTTAVVAAFNRLQAGESVLRVLADATAAPLVAELAGEGRAARALCVRMRRMLVAHGAHLRFGCSTRECSDLRDLVEAWKARTPADKRSGCIGDLNSGLRLCHASAVVGSRSERAARTQQMFNVAESSAQLVAAHARMASAQSRVVVAETTSRHLYRVQFYGDDHAPHMVLMGIYRHLVFSSADVVAQTTDVALGRRAIRFVVQRGSVYLPNYPGFEPIACSCKDWQYRVKTAALLGCKHIIAVRTRRAVHGAGGRTREELRSDRLQRSIAPRPARRQGPTA